MLQFGGPFQAGQTDGGPIAVMAGEHAGKALWLAIFGGLCLPSD
jgi:hypothetical protein